MSQSLKSRRATSYNIKEVNVFVARQLFCRTKEEFRTQLINCLLTGYPVRTEKYKPSVKSHGLHFVWFVLCDFGLSILQYGPGNQLIDSINNHLGNEAKPHFDETKKLTAERFGLH